VRLGYVNSKGLSTQQTFTRKDSNIVVTLKVSSLISQILVTNMKHFEA